MPAWTRRDKHGRGHGRWLGELAAFGTNRFLVGLLAIMALAGCASRPVNEPITQVDPKSGYRPYLLIPKRQNNDPHTLFILAFSGGGTRAAAFSYGVLEELRRTEIVIEIGRAHV